MDALLAAIPHQYTTYIFAVMGIAAALDALLPPTPAGSRWVLPRKALHLIGANFLNARNAVPAGAVPASVAAHAVEVRAAANTVEQAAATLGEAAKGEPEALRGHK
ncbi:MAG: hypothetical protein NVS1B6_06380 [Steroidobacteraceae bacterium]